MSRESCLYKRPKGRFLEVREDRVFLCDNDHCAAALMGVLARWTDWRLKSIDDDESDDEPWFFASKDQFRRDLLKFYSKASITKSLGRLVQMKLLEIKDADHVGGKNCYLFNYELANKRLMAVPEVFEIEDGHGPWTDSSVTNISHEPRPILATPVTNISHALIRKKRTDREEPAEQEPAPPASGQSLSAEDLPKESASVIQTTGTLTTTNPDSATNPDPTPLPPPRRSAPISLDMTQAGGILDSDMVDDEQFFKRYKGCGFKGAKNPAKADKLKLSLKYRPVPSVDLEAALAAWKQDSWAEANQYPIHTFVSQLDRWIETGRCEAGARQDEPEAPRPQSDIPREASSPPERVSRDYAAEWQAEFGEKARGLILTGTGFVDNFDAILPKVRDLRKTPETTWLTLAWLLKTAKDGGGKNWEAVISGKYDWKLRELRKADAYSFEGFKTRKLGGLLEKYGCSQTLTT